MARRIGVAGFWLSERRRYGVSAVVAAVVALVMAEVVRRGLTSIEFVDGVVLALLAYLLCYLAVTAGSFAAASPARIHEWARRENRGTLVQRYLLGTAPGPGSSLFIASAALVVAVVWLPGHGGGSLPTVLRVGVAVALIVVGWVCVAVSFAVAFHADNLVENGQALEFPGDDTPEWADYVYFSVSVMTTFGATDVTVTSREMRRTVTANAVIAFVFNTVTVATAVSGLTST